MSTVDDPRPLLTLLHVVLQREREAQMAALARRGFGGVTFPALRLLVELEAEARSVQALADATGTTKQFCAREVKKLEEAGYVSLERSEDDRRVTPVSLSGSGRKLLVAARAAKHELDVAVGRRLGLADARTLRRLLARLADEEATVLRRVEPLSYEACAGPWRAPARLLFAPSTRDQRCGCVGNHRSTAVPRPTRLVSVASPPWATRTRRTNARPSPVPPAFVV